MKIDMEEEKLKEYIKEFVKKMSVVVDDVEIIFIAAHTMFNIKTPDSKQLIGPHGEHLRSLNYIIRRSVERINEEKESKFMVDVNGYQYKHIQSLEQNATLLADRVRTFKSSAAMSPMTAYERMIIHAMFSDDKEISTNSDGIGPTRHIVLSYKEPSTT